MPHTPASAVTSRSGTGIAFRTASRTAIRAHAEGRAADRHQVADLGQQVDHRAGDPLHAGASGFLLKDVPPEQLVDGIRAVVSGESLLAPSITRRMIELYLARPQPGPPPEAIGSLTPREREILVLLARGLANAEIAERLFVSETTVKTDVARVLMMLGLRDRVQAVIFAYENDIVAKGSAVLDGS